MDNTCTKEGCDRYEYDYRLCLPHLKEHFGLVSFEKPKRKSRKKKIEAVDVLTMDATEETEVRADEDE